MGFKDTIEQHPIIVLAIAAFTAFGLGIGVITYLEGREDDLKSELVTRLTSENATLKAEQDRLSNELNDLSDVTKDLLKQVVEQRIEFAKLRGEISRSDADTVLDTANTAINGLDLRDIITNDVSGDVGKFIRDPLKGLKF